MNNLLKIQILVLGVLAACRSTNPTAAGKGGDDIVRASNTGANKNEESSNAVQKSVKEDVSQDELWQGVDSDRSSSGSKIGHVRCSYNQGVASCFMQSSKGVDTLVNMTKSNYLRSQIIATRSDLDVETDILADIRCEADQTKKESDSHDGVRCRFENGRSYNEALLSEELSTDLASLLRSDPILPDGLTTLSGIVSCHVMQRRVNATCVVRKIVRGGISEDGQALNRNQSLEMSEGMINAMLEVRRVQKVKEPFEVPPELAGSVQCQVDSKDVAQSGHRDAHCSIRL